MTATTKQTGKPAAKQARTKRGPGRGSDVGLAQLPRAGADLCEAVAGEGEARSATLWGYCRVSTGDQSTEQQEAALIAAGVPAERVVCEVASGTRESRPQLVSLLRVVREGDTLVVVRLDRLGRSMAHLVRTIDELGRRGVHFRSLSDPIDTSTASGRLVLGVMASLAEFEAALIRERTNAGLARVRAQGKPLGRRSLVTPEQVAAVHLYRRQGKSYPVIAASTGLSARVVGRIVRGEIAGIAHLQPESDDTFW